MMIVMMMMMIVMIVMIVTMIMTGMCKQTCRTQKSCSFESEASRRHPALDTHKAL